MVLTDIAVVLEARLLYCCSRQVRYYTPKSREAKEGMSHRKCHDHRKVHESTSYRRTMNDPYMKPLIRIHIYAAYLGYQFSARGLVHPNPVIRAWNPCPYQYRQRAASIPGPTQEDDRITLKLRRYPSEYGHLWEHAVVITARRPAL